VDGSGQVPAKWGYHYQLLVKLRDRLIGERGSRLDASAEPLEAHSLSMADAATDEFDHSLALGSLSSGQELLYEIEAALRRISAGTYGVCEETGSPIPTARLRAIPWTRFSCEVERRLEKQGGVNHASLGTVGTIRPDSETTVSPVETVQGEEEPPEASDEAIVEPAKLSRRRPSGQRQPSPQPPPAPQKA